MIYGMGTVFTFLALLILLTVTMSKLVANNTADEPSANQPTASVIPPSGAQNGPNAQLLKVLQAAVNAHKSAK